MWKLVACAANTFRRNVESMHAQLAGVALIWVLDRRGCCGSGGGVPLGAARPSWMLWDWGRGATGCCSIAMDVMGLEKGCYWVLFDRRGCCVTGEGVPLSAARSSWMLWDWGRCATG